MIKLRDDLIFQDPQARIREYCEVEVYHGYDDKHNIDNSLTKEDIDAANNLYAMIDRYDNAESNRLLSNRDRIGRFLSKIPNDDIFAFSDAQWSELKEDIEKLLIEFLSVNGIGLAKATKILHLKRPNFFPVLDSFVIKFLLDIDISGVEKGHQLAIGMQALNRARRIITEQKGEFENLVAQTRDLSVALTPVRIFDILCWTAEKWDIRGKLNAPYGLPHTSLLKPLRKMKDAKSASKNTESQGRYVVFEDLDNAANPRVHQTDCSYYKKWLSRPTTTTRWHGPYGSQKEAWETCKRISLRRGKEPKKHNCVEQ